MTAVAAVTRFRVVVDHTMPTPLQRSTKLKDIALIFLISVFSRSRLHLLPYHIRLLNDDKTHQIQYTKISEMLLITS